jgi:hypothetical protein
VKDDDFYSDSDNDAAGPSDYQMKEIKRTKNDIESESSEDEPVVEL